MTFKFKLRWMTKTDHMTQDNRAEYDSKMAMVQENFGTARDLREQGDPDGAMDIIKLNDALLERAIEIMRESNA